MVGFGRQREGERVEGRMIWERRRGRLSVSRSEEVIREMAVMAARLEEGLRGWVSKVERDWEDWERGRQGAKETGLAKKKFSVDLNGPRERKGYGWKNGG